MHQLVKRCYIYGILTVHVIETKSILMLLSKNTFRKNTQQMLCLIILTYSAIVNRGNVITT